ncbi:MAG TPA: hypothetical protein PLJ64_07800, partial [Solirubrobacterales bacterium]|nr:hypothetical protein [Solirubrobacterales bacterium]
PLAGEHNVLNALAASAIALALDVPLPTLKAGLEGAEHVKGRLVLSGESTAARMSRIARAVLHDLPLLSLDEMLARVDAVSVEDVSALASELYAEERLSAASVGRDEDRFRKAIQPVSEALAA